jgi:hypothetical protein
MSKPSWEVIDLRIKQLIAKDKNYHLSEIDDSDKLREDLRYDDPGLIALAPDINKSFFKKGKGLSQKEVVSCLKVIGLAGRVDEKPVVDFK